MITWRNAMPTGFGRSMSSAVCEAGRLAVQLANELQPVADYRANLRYKEIEITDAGVRKLAERCAAWTGFWRGSERRVELVRTALVAREFFLRDRQYVVSEG